MKPVVLSDLMLSGNLIKFSELWWLSCSHTLLHITRLEVARASLLKLVPRPPPQIKPKQTKPKQKKLNVAGKERRALSNTNWETKHWSQRNLYLSINAVKFHFLIYAVKVSSFGIAFRVSSLFHI